MSLAACAVAVAAAIVAVRAWALVEATRSPLWTHLRLDNLVYHEAARRLLAGDLTLGREVLHMSPGYTAFLATVYGLFGEGPWAWRLAQTALGLGAVLATADAARALAGRGWALVVALALGLYGPLIFYEAQMLPEALLTALHAALIASTVRVLKAPASIAGARAWAPYARTGLVWGACVLVRPNALLLGAPLLLALAASSGPTLRRRAMAAAVCALAAALAVAPVTLRNRVCAGEWVLVTDSGGLNFFIGNGPGAEGTFRIPPEVPGGRSAQTQFAAFRAVAERDRGRALSSRELDAYWFRRTWNHIAAHPAQWARLLVEKAWLFWSAREIPNTEDYAFARTQNRALAMPLVQFGALAPFAMVGTALWLARRRGAEAVVALFNLTNMAALVAFFVLAHYRLPAVPGLALAAMGCVQALVAWGAARAWRRLAAAGLALALTVPVVVAPKFPKPFDDEWYKLGVAWHRQAHLTEAEGCYRRALALNAHNVSARKNLAMLFEARGQRDEARAEWLRLLQTARARALPAYEREALAHLAP